MNCIICRKAGLVNGFTSIIFERDEFKLVIRNIPAQVCPDCGEALVDESTALRLLSEAEEIAGQGMPENELEF